jgi:serine/threonine protein kinase
MKKNNQSIQPITIESPEEILAFIDFIQLPNSKNYVVKEFYNYKLKDSDFHNEMNSYETISKIISKKENLVGMPYQDSILIGFEIQYKMTIRQEINNEFYTLLQNNPFFGISDFIHEKVNKRVFVINRKCQTTMNTKVVQQFSVGTFKKFVTDILQMIIKLNEINVAHGDIKLDNIMLCDGNYRLIDWEQSRKLNYNELKLDFLKMGSCPVYYMIKFGDSWEYVHTISIPIVIKMTGCNDRHSKTTSQYILDGIEYYKDIFENMPEDAAFEKVKHGLDVYSFGLILYGILEHNPRLQHHTKYHEFVNQIYRYENPKKALADFKSI